MTQSREFIANEILRISDILKRPYTPPNQRSPEQHQKLLETLIDYSEQLAKDTLERLGR